MAQTIFFVGKPYPQLKVLETMRRDGYRIGLFQDKNIVLKHPDKYDEVVVLDFASKDSLTEGLDHLKGSVDGLLCTYENYIGAKSVLAAFFGLPATDPGSATASTDKYLMREAFMRADPTMTPNFRQVTTLDEALAFGQEFGYPVMLKPMNLVKSLLVMKCADAQALIDNFNHAESNVAELYRKYRVYDRAPGLIVEEYVAGQHYSVAAFVDSAGEAHFCEGVVALTTAQQKGVNDNYIYSRSLPAAIADEQKAAIFSVARKGIQALQMKSTPAHVELIADQHGVKLIEIGARIGGYRARMYRCSYGLELVEAEIAVAMGQLPALQGAFAAYCAVYELFPDRAGQFAGITGAENTSSYDYYAVKAKPGQAVGPAQEGYKACAIIIVCSPDQTEFEARCQSVDGLRVKLA